MRKALAGIALSLAAGAAAQAAVVTYTMSLNDNGAGQLAFNNWAVYASASPDSAGLFGFGVDLLPFTGTLLNRANGLTLEDSGGSGEVRSLGFTIGRTQDVANGKFSGLQDLSAGRQMTWIIISHLFSSGLLVEQSAPDARRTGLRLGMASISF